VGTAVIGAGGVGLVWEKRLTLSASYLFVNEDSPSRSQGSIDLNLPEGTLPSRFMFKRAGKISAHWDLGRIWTLTLDGTYDLQHSGAWFASDLEFQPNRGKKSNQWRIGVGADLFSLNNDSGWFGQFRGNDRIRGRVSYVF